MNDSAVSSDTIVDKTLVVRKNVKACSACQQRFSVGAAFCPFDGTKLEAVDYEPPVDPLVGSTIDGRYRVVGLLGEGGMGTVYEVRHEMLGRSFAMKVLRRDVACEADLAARFINEAKATGSIKHPHIVSITDFGRLVDATPFFVMELLVGQTLAHVIKASGSLEMSRAYAILLQVVDALGAAHQAGVVHRDLKPENVFLAQAPIGVSVQSVDNVKIVDFGAAKVLGASRITKTGIVFGTPHYMSPEQASGQPIDHRTDVYALGVIMYEMLTGRVPFEADTYMGVLTQHMFVRPRPPSEVRPDRAEELGALEDITLRALEKRAEDRYSSMNDLAVDLEKAGRGIWGATSTGRSHLWSWPAEDTAPNTNSSISVTAPSSWPPTVAPKGVRPLVTVRTAALLGVLLGLVVLGLLSFLRPPSAPTVVAPTVAYAPAATVAPAPSSNSASNSALPLDRLPSPAGSVSSTAVEPPPASLPDSLLGARPAAAGSGADLGKAGTPPDAIPGHAHVTGRPTPRRASSGGELADPWAK
jgi:eukaryotic-like serine/threonine-protein kinase